MWLIGEIFNTTEKHTLIEQIVQEQAICSDTISIKGTFSSKDQ
jgi:hypothetical protein